MKIKEIIITIFFTVVTIVLCALNFIGNKYILEANSVYKVYLDGKIIGYIENDEDLYEIISNRQKEIKEKYNVARVYPPESFRIVKTLSYNVEISSAEHIYETLASLESFTIDGYIINIKSENKKITINVLDKKIFDSAVNNLVLAFLSEDEYNSYINDTQPIIEETGKIIERMYFDENITIKKGFIDTNQKIFTNETDISQFMLFGPDSKMNTYTVKDGDTIESISNDNKLNPQEFLIANPKYTNKDSLLKIGEEVNVTLINPVLTFSYEVHEVSDAKIQYEKKTVYDNTKEPSYSEITTQGVTGISRMTTKYVVKNGEMQSGVVTIGDPITIVEKVDEVTTKGGSPYSNYVRGTYVDTGNEWGWPTNSPYIITSGFGYRWGTLHEGIDISGTGHGSPIYSVMEGTVYSAGWEIPLCLGGGYCAIVGHPNGFYTLYAHLSTLKVKTGDKVSRGQVLGLMGATGYAMGTHLHFCVWYGVPYANGSKLYPPLDVIG